MGLMSSREPLLVKNVPTEQPTRFYVLFNRKALAAGVEIPHSLLMRADEMIE